VLFASSLREVDQPIDQQPASLPQLAQYSPIFGQQSLIFFSGHRIWEIVGLLLPESSMPDALSGQQGK